MVMMPVLACCGEMRIQRKEEKEGRDHLLGWDA